jgi:hypothetical protein
LECPRGFSWPPGAVPEESCQGNPRRARLMSQTRASQQSAIRRAAGSSRPNGADEGSCATHNRDREHHDHEQAFEPEHERRRSCSKRGLRTHGHVEHCENHSLDRDSTEDVADRNPEIVRERNPACSRDEPAGDRDHCLRRASEGFPRVRAECRARPLSWRARFQRPRWRQPLRQRSGRAERDRGPRTRGIFYRNMSLSTGASTRRRTPLARFSSSRQTVNRDSDHHSRTPARAGGDTPSRRRLLLARLR